MESLNALIQGMGLMHLGAGQAVMLLVSLLLLWLAIAKKFEPLLLLPIGFGGLLSNIPEAGLALTALESLLAHHDPAQLAVIAAKLHCAPDVHAIRPRHQRGTGAGPAVGTGADGEPRGGHGLLRRGAGHLL